MTKGTYSTGLSGWRHKPAAVSLLIAYLLVLQGFTAGFAANGKSAAGGLFGNAICLSKPDPLNGGNPALPVRSGQRHEGCCAFHSAGMGAPPESPFDGGTDRPQCVSGSTTASATLGLAGFLATLPVGSRAPPSLYL